MLNLDMNYTGKIKITPFSTPGMITLSLVILFSKIEADHDIDYRQDRG